MAAALVNQLHTLMANMFATGLLDEQFQQLRMLQDGSAPDFVSEVVTLFCEDGERIIGELAKLMDKPSVDFDKVDAFVHQLKGSSASIGAQKVKNTCIQFREFCQQKSRDRCLKTLDMVRNEFYDLRNKFQTMLQSRRAMQWLPRDAPGGWLDNVHFRLFICPFCSTETEDWTSICCCAHLERASVALTDCCSALRLLSHHVLFCTAVRTTAVALRGSLVAFAHRLRETEAGPLGFIALLSSD